MDVNWRLTIYLIELFILALQRYSSIMFWLTLFLLKKSALSLLSFLFSFLWLFLRFLFDFRVLQVWTCLSQSDLWCIVIPQSKDSCLSWSFENSWPSYLWVYRWPFSPVYLLEFQLDECQTISSCLPRVVATLLYFLSICPLGLHSVISSALHSSSLILSLDIFNLLFNQIDHLGVRMSLADEEVAEGGQLPSCPPCTLLEEGGSPGGQLGRRHQILHPALPCGQRGWVHLPLGTPGQGRGGLAHPRPGQVPNSASGVCPSWQRRLLPAFSFTYL